MNKAIFAAILAKLAFALPTGQQQQQSANPNMPAELAKHYAPSNVNTNTLKYPIFDQFCSDSSDSTTLISIDGVLVPMMADAGWYTVTYGAQYTYADQIFVLNNKKTAILQMTGCYCPGNVFQVFDNGTPITLTDDCTFPQPTEPTCENREPDPFTCSQSTDFCHGAALLEPGYHNISIGILASPWGAGASYIRVDTAAQGDSSFMNLPLTPLCEITGVNNCNQNVVE